MLKHYKIYDIDDEGNYQICIEHPTDLLHTLCGSRISDTLDGQPESTKENITCEYCLIVIKEIKELSNEQK